MEEDGGLALRSLCTTDYEVQLHKRRMILRQKDMDVSKYTEEFHNLVMNSSIVELENLKLAR